MTTLNIGFPKTIEVQKRWIIEKAQKRVNNISLVLDELTDMDLQKTFEDLEDLVEIVISDSTESSNINTEDKFVNKIKKHKINEFNKVCPKCGVESTNEIELNSLFHNNSFTKDGKQSYCKSCINEKTKRSKVIKYKNDPEYREKIKERNRRHYLKRSKTEKSQTCLENTKL